MEAFSFFPGSLYRWVPVNPAAPGGQSSYDRADSVQAGPLTRDTGMQRGQDTPAGCTDTQAADSSMAAAAETGETG